MSELKDKVKRWYPNVLRWCNQGTVPVPPALILAIIQMESAGNSVAIRREPKYLQMYGKTKKFQEIIKVTGLSPDDIATSYGLMQLMVMTAWGYLSQFHKGPNVICFLLDPNQNIRYGTAHLATKLAKNKGNIRLAARDYNGTGAMAEAYGRNAQQLYLLYDEWIKGGGQHL